MSNKFSIEVVRTGIGSLTFPIFAETMQAAVQGALAQAGDHEFREKSAEYDVEGHTIGGRIILSGPLSGAAGEVEGVVRVAFSEAFGGGEAWLDALSNALVGHDCLMNIEWRILGAEDGGVLLVEVRGEAEDTDGLAPE